MGFLFKGCNNFNKPLDKWDVSNVIVMHCMFEDCKKFNQCLDDWKIDSLKECKHIMDGCVKYTFNKIQLPNTI